ncbi:MAG TPA: porin family protein [Saprospiraceae bacterium]|nr:porin family protein [Saprospiraceae bacterium]
MKVFQLFLLLTLPAGMFSQDIRFCILNGPSISWMRSNDNIIKSSGTKIAYKANVQAEYWFNDRYGVTAGLGLSVNQGGGMEYEKGGNIWKEADLSDNIYRALPANALLEYRFNHLDIPFGFKLRTNEFGRYRFYVHAPEFSISLRTKARGNIDAPPLPDTEDEDIRKMNTFLALFYAIGVGAEIRVSTDVSLIGGLRFYQSISDLTDDSGVYSDGTKENSKGILSSLDFRLGVIF